MAFVGRFFDPPAQSYYLFGPRGTGKSAWTQHRYRDRVRIDLLRPATLQRYRARPDRLFDLVHAQPDGQVIVIDEVNDRRKRICRAGRHGKDPAASAPPGPA